MKKLTLILGAVVLGFVLSSCTKNPSENILKQVNDFFTQAETKINAIDNAADLVNFVHSFADEKEQFGQKLDETFGKDENGIYKGMTAEGMEQLMNSISERATEYNKIEYAKCGEIMKPYIEKFDGIVKALVAQREAGEEFQDETVDQLKSAYEDITNYADIVPEELANIFYADDEIVTQLFPKAEEE